MQKQDSKSFSEGLRHITPYMDLGLRFALAAILGAAAGYWLDMKFNCQPIGLILGAMLGAVAGFINLYQNVMRLTQEDAERIKRKQR